MAAFIIYHMCNCQKYGGIPIWENCNVRSVRGIMPIWFYFRFVDSYSLPRPMPVMMLAWPYSALVTPMYILVQLPFIIERSAKNPKLNFTDYGAPPCTVFDHCIPLRSFIEVLSMSRSSLIPLLQCGRMRALPMGQGHCGWICWLDSSMVSSQAVSRPNMTVGSGKVVVRYWCSIWVRSLFDETILQKSGRQ